MCPFIKYLCDFSMRSQVQGSRFKGYKIMILQMLQLNVMIDLLHPMGENCLAPLLRRNSFELRLLGFITWNPER